MYMVVIYNVKKSIIMLIWCSFKEFFLIDTMKITDLVDCSDGTALMKSASKDRFLNVESCKGDFNALEEQEKHI